MPDDPKFEKHLAKVTRYWSGFVRQLEFWMEQDWPGRIAEIDGLMLSDHKEWCRLYYSFKNETVKRHVSSTHDWIPGKQHYSSKTDNVYESPFECSQCGMCASNWEHESFMIDSKEPIKLGCQPSSDMHNQLFHRTCQNVQAARKKRTGRVRCGQCRTYGCLNDYSSR